jgi:hypothetical protein
MMAIRQLIFTTAAFLSFTFAPATNVRCQEQDDPNKSSPERQQNVLEKNTTASDGQSANDQTQSTLSQSAATTTQYSFPGARQRFDRYVSNTVGPKSLTKVAAVAAIGQWNDNPDEWGQGASGYGKRFASSFGSNAITQTVTYGLSEAFHLDTGFEKSRREGFWPRLSDALVQNVTSRTRSGRRVISAPRLIGVYTGTIVPAETWYPSRYTYRDGLRSGTYNLAAGFGLNLLREFVFNW